MDKTEIWNRNKFKEYHATKSPNYENEISQTLASISKIAYFFSEKAEDEGGGADDGDDPTFELANVRRFIIGKESVSKFVENSRKMFLLRVMIHYLKNKVGVVDFANAQGLVMF